MRRAQAFRALYVLCTGGALAGIWLGCADEAPQLTVSQGCSLSSECKSPLVCAFAKCHQACKSSRDCSSGERCVQSDRPYYVCQKQACTRNSECLGKQVCAQDGQCHDECLTQKDCLTDQVCTAGACADEAELVNGALPNVLSDAGGIGQRCTLPTDCPGDLVCLRGGVCGAECIGDKDCLKTYTCKPLHEGGPGRCFPANETPQDASVDAVSMQDASLSDAADAADANDTGDAADASDAGGGPPSLDFAMGYGHSCAVLNGKVKCWGGQGLGYGDPNSRGGGPNEMGDNLPFVDFGTGLTAKGIFIGYGSTYVILSDGRLKAWGSDDAGIGLGDLVPRGNQPNQMGDSLPFVDLGAGRTVKSGTSGFASTCVILDTAQVKCWGKNDVGQLGLGDTQHRGDGPNEMGSNLPFVNLGAGRTAKQIVSGFHFMCAVLDNNRVKCWGKNDVGQLGLGDTQDRGDGPNEMGDALPYVDLGTGRTAKYLGIGQSSVCAILDNDTTKCWGDNGAGQLGLGDTNPRGAAAGQMGDNLPVVDLGTGRVAKRLAQGDLISMCAVLDNGALKCWGANNYGVLGLGDAAGRGFSAGQMGNNLPTVNLGTGRTATEVYAGVWAHCARLDNDQFKCWGWGNAGHLGLGDTLDRGAGPTDMGDNLPYVKLVGP